MELASGGSATNGATPYSLGRPYNLTFLKDESSRVQGGDGLEVGLAIALMVTVVLFFLG